MSVATWAAEAEVATAAFTALNEIPNGQCKFAYFKSDNWVHVYIVEGMIRW